MLFTGAGFSANARARDGQPLPDSQRMIQELWELVFEDGSPDGSTLADLYDVALERVPDRLRSYLAERLHVGSAPGWYAAWFAAPWRRIYTLNVDDLEIAVARGFALPRPLRSVSALGPRPPRDARAIDVVHLNGIAGDDPRQVTFSTLQYAARLCRRDRGYQELVADLAAAPFVFVGTTLDEAVLWQQMRASGFGLRPPASASCLISPSLPRARQLLLERHGIAWICGTAEQIASSL